MGKTQKKPPRKLHIIPINFKEKEILELKRLAQVEGLPVSTYIKRLIYTHPKGLPLLSKPSKG